jgi:hypothetical protein
MVPAIRKGNARTNNLRRARPDPGQAGLGAARRAGRTGGRPPKLTDDDIEAAKAMPANPDIGNSNRAPPRRLSGDALSLHPRRTNRGYPGRLRTALYSKSRTPHGGGVSLSVDNRWRAVVGLSVK